jgi:hypothetical protein
MKAKLCDAYFFTGRPTPAFDRGEPRLDLQVDRAAKAGGDQFCRLRGKVASIKTGRGLSCGTSLSFYRVHETR